MTNDAAELAAAPDSAWPIDHETVGLPPGHRDLRLWLRLLTLTTSTETGVRGLLRTEFSTTLPRFDFLAALHKANGALTMGDLSRRLIVTNGNVTGLSERLGRGRAGAAHPGVPSSSAWRLSMKRGSPKPSRISETVRCRL